LRCSRATGSSSCAAATKFWKHVSIRARKSSTVSGPRRSGGFPARLVAGDELGVAEVGGSAHPPTLAIVSVAPSSTGACALVCFGSFASLRACADRLRSPLISRHFQRPSAGLKVPKVDINCRDCDVRSLAEPEPDRHVFAKFKVAQGRRALGRNHLRHNRRNPPSIYAQPNAPTISETQAMPNPKRIML
jgi:hypothetical protein